MRKHSGSFSEDKEADCTLLVCEHRARVVKRTSTGPSQVTKHGMGFLKSIPGKAETGRTAKLQDFGRVANA